MTELELEQAILDYIVNLYQACYNGYIKVEKLNPGYKLSIGVPSYMYPTTIAGDFATDEDFLNFIYEELRTRNYMRVYFYKVVRTPSVGEEGPTSDQPVFDNPTCPPRRANYTISTSTNIVFPFTFPYILQ